MKQTDVIQTKDLAGQEVELFGWVANRRDHGKLVFVDLRDRTGVIQLVFSPKTGGYEDAQKLRNEWVVRIRGSVKERPENMRNPELPTGSVEFAPQELEILNEAQTPVMPLDTDGLEIGEDTRHEWRYLDLRRARLATHMRVRPNARLGASTGMSGGGALGLETPMLTKSTPEGARDYVVPSRL